MARPVSKYPTELELEILKVLWREGGCTVREVREGLQESRRLAYTSVQTVLNIMTKKKYLERSKCGRSFLYHSRISEEATLRGILLDTVDRLFQGSAVSAVTEILQARALKPQDVKRLRRHMELLAQGEGS